MKYKNTQYTPENITSLQPNEVFVFGSNRQGIHGAGAARFAVEKCGAIMGQSSGLMGNSYGIVTKDFDIYVHKGSMRSVSLAEIKQQIETLYKFAEQNPSKTFYVTKIGSLLAGYTVEEIAECFTTIPGIIPSNIILPIEFI